MPRQLKNVVVKGVALVGRPANRKPIHLFKNQGGSVAAHSAADTSAESGVIATAAPATVVEAIHNIQLAKGESDQASAALEGIATLLHNNPHLTLQDLMAAGEASGLADIEKAGKKKMKEGEWEEEDADDEEEDDSEDEDAEDEPKGIDKLPPALRAKAKARQAAKKSAGVSQAEGETMPVDVEKGEQVTITKAEHKLMMERLAKAESEWRRHEQLGIHKALKEENQAQLAGLVCDHDQLANIMLTLNKADKAQGKALVAMLKGFNAQIDAAEKSGTSIFKSQARPNGASPSEGYAQWKSLVKAEMEKSGCSEAMATLKVAKTEDGNRAYLAHRGN